jgi:hypothetical protein
MKKNKKNPKLMFLSALYLTLLAPWVKVNFVFIKWIFSTEIEPFFGALLAILSVMTLTLIFVGIGSLLGLDEE